MQWLNSATGKKMTPSRRKLKAKGETSTLQKGKYTIMQKFYQSSQLNDKNAFRELKNVFFSRFQLYAKAYVNDAYTSGASEKFLKVMNIKKQCWTPQRRVCKLWFVQSHHSPKNCWQKFFSWFIKCYKTDGKWINIHYWVVVTLRGTIA